MRIKKISLPFDVKKTLAFGSHLKNRVCFADKKCAYLGSVHDDLSNLEDFLAFKKDIRYFLRKNPGIFACDLHPEYQSTKFAQDLRRKRHFNLQMIQHHHAHIASCMAENGLRNQKLIGIAFDGTGLGDDNELWGAEFLICDYSSFKRIAHLRKIPLFGGEKVIFEPWRAACAWLWQAYKDKFLHFNIDFIRKLDKGKIRIFKSIEECAINCPAVSSMGRLFDAAASLILNKHQAHFQAELAISLEKLAAHYRQIREGYNFKITKSKGIYEIDPRPVFKGIIKDLLKKMAREEIAYKFHQGISDMIELLCLRLRKTHHLNRVAIAGGVFQNNLLLNKAKDSLVKKGFQVFIHEKLSFGDSSICLGQLAIANSKR